MGSLGFSISMIASLSPTLMESKLISSMVCVSTPSLSSVSLVSSSGTNRRARNLGLKSSMSPSIQTTPDSDVGAVSSATSKKVLVPIGYGTDEIEAVVLVDILRRAGAEVTVASVEQKLEVEASSGTRLLADVLISKCADQVYDLVALPGGMPGSVRLRDCEILEKIMKRQAEDKRLYGAISMAPAITLLPWGLLTRKKFIVQDNGTSCFFREASHIWAVKTNIQISGELTTSRGPGTSFQFALSLAKQLFGETTAKSVEDFLLLRDGYQNPKKEEFNSIDWSLNHTPRVLIPVANGSEEVEVVTIADVLRRAKVDVTVASVERSLRITASQGTKIITDKLIGEAAESTYDLIVLPGGHTGSERLQKSKILKTLLKEQHESGRIYGATNSSSTVLYKHGLLKEKMTTVYPSDTDERTNQQMIEGAELVIDGNVITSLGLATVTKFSLAIVSKLFGHGRARSISEGLVHEYPRHLTPS